MDNFKSDILFAHEPALPQWFRNQLEVFSIFIPRNGITVESHFLITQLLHYKLVLLVAGLKLTNFLHL